MKLELTFFLTFVFGLSLFDHPIRVQSLGVFGLLLLFGLAHAISTIVLVVISIYGYSILLFLLYSVVDSIRMSSLLILAFLNNFSQYIHFGNLQDDLSFTFVRSSICDTNQNMYFINSGFGLVCQLIIIPHHTIHTT